MVLAVVDSVQFTSFPTFSQVSMKFFTCALIEFNISVKVIAELLLIVMLQPIHDKVYKFFHNLGFIEKQ